MQVLIFDLGKEKLAINVNIIEAIEQKVPLTIVPKSKKYVLGLINMRGNVIPVIDISIALDINTSVDNFEKFIIVNLENGKIALAVTDIDNVLDIQEENIESIYVNKSVSVINVEDNIITLLTIEELKKI